MSLPISFPQVATPITPQDRVQENIRAYISAREAFDQAGGQAFINDRRTVRDAYCNATVSDESINTWISNLPSQDVQHEFINRFKEWNAKIAKGINGVVKSANPTVSQDQFIQKLQTYYVKHQTFLEAGHLQSHLIASPSTLKCA